MLSEVLFGKIRSQPGIQQSASNSSPLQSSHYSRESQSSSHSPISASTASGKRKADDTSAKDGDKVLKRQKNTMAARKYRQKRLDHIADLEKALGDMTEDRDELRLKLARREAEVDALREMLMKK